MFYQNCSEAWNSWRNGSLKLLKCKIFLLTSLSINLLKFDRLLLVYILTLMLFSASAVVSEKCNRYIVTVIPFNITLIIFLLIRINF